MNWEGATQRGQLQEGSVLVVTVKTRREFRVCFGSNISMIWSSTGYWSGGEEETKDNSRFLAKELGNWWLCFPKHRGFEKGQVLSFVGRQSKASAARVKCDYNIYSFKNKKGVKLRQQAYSEFYLLPRARIIFPLCFLH